MANGELCKKCRHQETQHEHGEPWAASSACETFESELPHHEDCPVLDCNGDCDLTIKKAAAEARAIEHRASQFWSFDGRDLTIVDIGT